MKRFRPIHPWVLVIGLIVASVHVARADVSPGEVIDKTNWEKAQGLLPEPVLDWVKKGDFVLNIAEPNFELSDCFPPFQIQAFETNAGKYELDAAGGIIETKTGKPPEHIVGLPFPKIEGDDPRLAEKLVQNNHYMQYLGGGVRAPYQGILLNRSGFVLEGDLLGMQYLWISADVYSCSYKVIYDRAGEYWKTLYIAGAPCESDDKSMRFMTRTSQQMVDDRWGQSSVIEDCSPRNRWAFFAVLDVNDFSLAGFQKFCK